MKKRILFLIFFISQLAHAQNNLTHSAFLRIYEDNDALNISGKSTDWGYTNGSRLDIFYTPGRIHSNPFTAFNKLAGEKSLRTSGWGLMQVIMAPRRTSLSIPDKNDYAYAGALYGVHTIHSSNEAKKTNVQSEWIFGLMGSPSFAKQTQIFFHHLIKDPLPKGWDYQLPTDLLLNNNVSVEKQVAAFANIGLIGGGEMSYGTMRDGIALDLLLTMGGKPGYFSGLTNQYFATNRKKPKLLVTLRSTIDYTAYDAFLEGGLFNKDSPFTNKNSKSGTYLKRQKFGASLDLFTLVSFRGLSVSFTQKTSSTEFKGYGKHTTGIFSICTKL